MHLTASPLYRYVSESMAYSAIVLLAVLALIRIWKITSPSALFNFYLATLVLPAALPLAFLLAGPARDSLVFRDRIAVLDLRRWSELGVGSLSAGDLVLLVGLATTVVFFAQEVIPLALRAWRREPAEPIAQGRFHTLDQASATAARLVGHPLPPLFLSRSPGFSLRVKGLIRPSIIVSEGLLASATEPELTAMLCHELGHLVRRDHWTSWALIAVRAAAFFNPIAWFASRMMWQENELMCDDLAARATGEPLSLASALVKAAGGRTGSRVSPGRGEPHQKGTAPDSHLGQRIRRLLDFEKASGRPAEPARLLVSATMITVLLFFVV